MEKQEKGNWAPYNSQSIVRNIESVFKNRDIQKLRKGAYKFIIQHMGFIAHYDLGGFQAAYRDLREFSRNLLTSEYSDNEECIAKEASRQESDRDFKIWYGERYQKSVAETMRGILVIVKQYRNDVIENEAKKEKENDLLMIRNLATKHNLSLNIR